MNFGRVRILARKDLDEIRSGRSLLATVVIPPLLFAVLFPIAILSTVSLLPGTVAPLPLHPTVQMNYSDVSVSQGSFRNVSFDHSLVSTSVVVGSVIRNTTLSHALIIGSVLENVVLYNCSVQGSNLYSSTVDSDTVLTNSPIVGEASPRELAVSQLTGLFEFFLVLTPVFVPSTLAAYTVVGEKTNRSLEPLLATPLTDQELLWGKALAIFAATMAATWVSFILFQGIVTYELSKWGIPFAPGAVWYVLMLLVAPLACLLAIAVNVMVSARVNDARTGQQLSGLVLLPVLGVLLILGLGLVAGGFYAVLLLALGLAVADVLLFRVAARVFGREEILARWK